LTFTNVDFSTVSGSIDLVIEGRSPTNLEWVSAEATGSDWLWIDQVEVFDGGFLGEVWQRGVDNTVGYCLSTVPNHGSSAICEPDLSALVHQWTPP
jgi:hypothetical protein